MRPVSLRTRLLAGVIALAAVCLVVLGVVLYAQQRDFLMERVDDQARAAPAAVGRALDVRGVPGGAPPDRYGDRRPPGDGKFGGPRRGDGPKGGPPASLPPGVYGERRDATGRVLGSVVLTFGETTASSPKLPKDLPLDRLVTVGDYRVNASPDPDGSGVTVAAVPLDDVDEQLDRLLAVEGAVIGGVLLLMAGLGWWVVRVSLRPLDRIGETADEIAAGHGLSRRVTPDDDRTEVGRLGRSLNAMLHQIEGAFAEREESEERLRRFLSDASHELRTPLSSIRGYAELYRMGAATDPQEAEKAITRIEQEAARMGVLVEDLLVLARLDEVRDPVRAPVDLAELARDAVADARATAPDREIAFDADAEETVVSAEAHQLRQVLANLLRNALVHTPDGTPIDVRVSRAGDRVRFEVRDHGNGLPVDDGDVLFERFWRADPGRGRGRAGAGLGLAIVHGLVAAHGGTVRAENAAGGGARFTVELPGA